MSDGELVALSPLMAAAAADLARSWESDEAILVSGESGAGVGWICDWAHGHSLRHNSPLVTFHCGALAPGHVEDALFGPDGAVNAARGGTLLLRSFDALTRTQQERALAGDIRVVATVYNNDGNTPERSLDSAIVARFLHRVEVPPLRSRREDLRPLAVLLTNRIACASDSFTRALSEDDIERFSRHDWPGNVRELEQTIHVLLLER
jgi:two-component system NtrC family response regulator